MGGVDDDGDADSNIGNDTNCGDGRSKVDCSKDTAVMTVVVNWMVVVILMMMVRVVMTVMVKLMSVLMDTRIMVMMIDVWILLETTLKINK